MDILHEKIQFSFLMIVTFKEKYNNSPDKIHFYINKMDILHEKIQFSFLKIASFDEKYDHSPGKIHF
jgi:hypothetical protein